MKKIKNITIVQEFEMKNHAANSGINETGNSNSIKKLSDNRSYISSQMIKHAAFEKMSELNENDKIYVSNSDGVTTNLTTDLRADFGGFLTFIGGEDSKDNKKTVRRKAAIDCTFLIAVEESNLNKDFLVRLSNRLNSSKNKKKDSKEEGTDQAIVETEFSEKDTMRMSTSLDLNILGIYKHYEYNEKEHVKTTEYSAYDVNEKINRCKLYINSFTNLTSLAKQARFATSSEPTKICIIFDTIYSRYACNYFELNEQEKIEFANFIRERGGEIFTAENSIDSYKEKQKALNYLNSENIHYNEKSILLENPIYNLIKNL